MVSKKNTRVSGKIKKDYSSGVSSGVSSEAKYSSYVSFGLLVYTIVVSFCSFFPEPEFLEIHPLFFFFFSPLNFWCFEDVWFLSLILSITCLVCEGIKEYLKKSECKIFWCYNFINRKYAIINLRSSAVFYFNIFYDSSQHQTF